MRKIVFLTMLTLTVFLSVQIYAAKSYQLQPGHDGMECVDCHGKEEKKISPKDEVIGNETCLSCHESFEAVGELTKDMHQNPHLSAHFYELECSSCHMEHKAIQNFCVDCHGPISRNK